MAQGALTTSMATTNGHGSNNLNGHAKLNGNTRTHGQSEANTADRDRDEHTPLENLVAVSATVLLQAVDLVANVLQDDAQLTYVSKYIPGSTIGKHLRHARDHFALLLDSVEGHPDFPSTSSASTPAPPASTESTPSEVPSTPPELCYDVRARGTPMEGSRAAAGAELERQVARLQALVGGSGLGAEEVSKCRMDSVVMLSAVTPHLQIFTTSFGRELWFAALHAVHHWSMVRVIAGELNLQLEDQFGIAPSTLVYHGTEGPLGKSKI